MYTGRMMEGLIIARRQGKTLAALKYKNDLDLIGLEITDKKNKIEK